MPAEPSNAAFAALVEEGAHAVKFTPLMQNEAFLPFELLALAPLTSEAARDLPLETYDRAAASHIDASADAHAASAFGEPDARQLRSRIADLQAEISQARAAFDVEREELSRIWQNETASAFKASIRDAEIRISQALAKEIGSVLEPFVSEAIRVKIMEEFVSKVCLQLFGSEGARVLIRAPSGWLPAARQAFGDRLAHADFTLADTPEITAELDSRLISTRFTYWSSLLPGNQINEPR